MKTIKVETVRNVAQTKECIPKLKVGEVFSIQGSEDTDGIYIAKEISTELYASDVCKLCPFNRPNGSWGACNMYRKIKSGHVHPICLLNCKSYWPRLEIRKLDDIMEAL